MEIGQLERLPEIIECDGYPSESWPNITGAKFTGMVEAEGWEDEDDSFGATKKYSYTFNNLWNKEVTFCLELIGREFEYLNRFKIIKITTKKLTEG
jgi:hypothetical protein